MAAQSRKKRSRKGAAWWTSPRFRGLLLLTLAAYLCLSLTAGSGPWWLALSGGEAGDLLSHPNPGGLIGTVLSLGLRVALGAVWCWLCPLLLLFEGFGLLLKRRSPVGALLRALAPLYLASVALLGMPVDLMPVGAGPAWSGVPGYYLARGFVYLFGIWGSRIFLGLLLLGGVTFLLRRWLRPVESRLLPAAGSVGRVLWRGIVGLGRALAALVMVPVAWIGGVADGRHADPNEQAGTMDPDSGQMTGAEELGAGPRRLHVAESEEEPLRHARIEGRGAAPKPKPKAKKAPKKPAVKPVSGPVVLPSLQLLREPDDHVQHTSRQQLDASADLLEDTLRSFGVQGEVKDVRPGPVVTTFEYQPGPGIRVNQIVQRADDLALAMKARSIRMEAPIPGKAAVGIEIPNPSAQIVRLKEVLEVTDRASQTPLTVMLGKDVIGQPVSIDINKLPHLLVAGSTGSGKSVCLNAIICSLLLHNTPDTVRLVLIDPKMLEMSVYNGIPHLLLPVVTDPKEALKALKWMVAQMDLRYRKLAKCGVRDIGAYNVKVAKGQIEDREGEVVTEPMPYYVTIVDELADLMLQLGQEFEMPITRLAQKARAVGIHLILATQRPSVDVLTGVIKANVPCRIAFRVIQKNDSRTILDMNGAEQLLGNGDMLYLQPGRALPVRVHGCFLDTEECEAITDHWQRYTGTTEEISLDESPTGGGTHTGEDDLFGDARRIVVLHQSGSTSLLQRRLRVGYTRAGRLMDMLEEAGIVGPFTGSKARDVLLKQAELEELEAREEEG